MNENIFAREIILRAARSTRRSRKLACVYVPTSESQTAQGKHDTFGPLSNEIFSAHTPSKLSNFAVCTASL